MTLEQVESPFFHKMLSMISYVHYKSFWCYLRRSLIETLRLLMLADSEAPAQDVGFHYLEGIRGHMRFTVYFHIHIMMPVSKQRVQL